MNKLTSTIHSFCSYYQAEVFRPEAWFVVAVLKSFDHMVLDRTLDPSQSIFEFFVPAEMEDSFLEIMAYFERNHLIKNLQKLPNRLMDGSQHI